MNPCPTPAQLEQLLAVQLRSPEAEAVEAHVEACAACQQQLEEMTNTSAFPGPQQPDPPDPREQPAAVDSGEDFLRRLAQKLPTGTWAFQGAAGGAEASTPPVTDRTGAATAEQPVVAGYDILGPLGRGGMGVVYRARQRDAQRIVALKMILAGAQARPEEVARFRTEIEAVANGTSLRRKCLAGLTFRRAPKSRRPGAERSAPEEFQLPGLGEMGLCQAYWLALAR